MVADLELEGVEHLAFDVLGQAGKGGFDDRELVEQAPIVLLRLVWAVGEGGELFGQVFPLGRDLGEALPELATPLLVDVLIAGGLVFAKLFHEVGLLVLQILDLVAQRRGSRRCRVFDRRLVGVGRGEECVPVGAEDTAGEEAADELEEFVLIHQHAFRVGGEPVHLGVVSGDRFARVVAVHGGWAAAGFAVEAPPAQFTDDVGP